MKRYWVRIAAGAFLIFVVGMVVVNVGRRGVDHVKQHAMDQAFNLTPDVAPFQVGTRRLGALTRVSMEPQGTGGFPLFNLMVKLDSAIPASGLGDCLLLASDGDPAGGHGLECVSGLSTDSLVEIGSVRFEPSGEVQSIYLPASQLEGKSWFQRVSRISRVGTTPRRERSFNLQADESGNFMLIMHEKARPVFQMNADSHGAFIQIRDSNGVDVVRFRADSQGVTGQINSD